MALPESLKEYRSAFEAIRDDARELIAPLSGEQFNRQPAPGRWSAAECISHLVVVGRPLVEQMETAIAEQRQSENASPTERVRLGLIGGLFVRLLHPATRLPMPSPAAYAPEEKEHDPAELVSTFVNLQNRFITCAEAGSEVNLNRMRIPSPAWPILRLRATAWLASTISHEKRHLEQVKRTLRAVGVTESPLE